LTLQITETNPPRRVFYLDKSMQKSKASQTAKSNSVMQSISAKIIRCGCTPDQKLMPLWHGAVGKTCPNPRGEENHGIVSFWHRNPIRRLFYWFRRRILRQTVQT
jgi:hypothetical protein